MGLFPDSVIARSIELYTARISAKSKAIYWIIITGILLGLMCLPFISVDISVQARGLFQADIEKQTVSASVHGRVIYSGIQTGDKLEQGDTIIVMDSEGLRAQLRALETLANENERSIRDLEYLADKEIDITNVTRPALLTRRYAAEKASFIRQMKIQNQRYRNGKTEFIRDSVLFEQNVISAADYENSLNRYILEKQNTDQLRLAQLSQWQNDLTNRYADDRKLRAEIGIKLEEISYRTVVSPVRGTIIHSEDIQRGSFVAAGQKIAEISPESQIIAVFYVAPSDIGFINRGQRVRLQVDAYNYHQWGMLDGRITEISDDLIYDNVSAYFRIKCAPDRPFLSLKNGVTSEVTKGMTFTARVMITRRTLFDLLFDKADKWFNPYTGRNQ